MVTATELRRRTRESLLRERQRQLQRIPTPVTPPTEIPTEVVESQRRFEEGQRELQSEIDLVQDKITRKTVDLEAIRTKIAETEARTGERPRALSAQLNLASREISELQSRQSILTSSYSLSEATARQSIFQAQFAERLTPRPGRVETTTITDLPPRQIAPFLREDVVRTFRIKGRDIPVTKVMYIDPSTGQRREATATEYEAYRKGTRFLKIPEEKTFLQKITTPLVKLKYKIEEKPIGRILERGKEFAFGEVPVGVTVIPGARVTGREVAEVAARMGLPGRVISQFIPETPAELAFVGGVGVLAVTSGIVGATTRVSLGGLGGYVALQKDRPTEERIAGGIVALAAFAPAFIKGGIKTMRDFSKLGKKGTAQLTELERFFKKDAQKKSELQKALDRFSAELNYRREGKVIRDTTISEKVELMSKAFDKIKKTTDPELKRKQVEGMVKIIRAEIGEARAAVVFREFLSQEGITAVTPKQVTEFGIMSGQIRGELQKVGVIPTTLISTDLLTAEKNLFFVTEEESLKVAEEERAALITTQISALAPKQLFFQPQLLAQVPRLAQPQLLVSLLAQQQLFRQPSRLRRVRPRRRIPKVRKPAPKKIKIPRLSKESIKKVKKALTELKGQGVNVVVGMEKKKQKILYKNLPPREAYVKAQKYVDRNIQASFKIVPTGKKIKKKDIKKVSFSGKYRPSKVNPLFQVEKKKYRLDMPGEKRQIKRAKQRKKR